MKKTKRIKYIKSLDEIPVFKSEQEEVDYWDTHRISPELLEQLPSETIQLSDELIEKIKARKGGK